MSCSKPALFAFFGLSPSSEAITAQRLAVSLACWSKFWPYEERYFILPTILINSGCRPWMPRSMAVRLPVSITSLSSCFLTFATTSSMRAGWIRPSATNWCSANLQTSRRIGSKAEMTIASGVSSIIKSTPVTDSIVLTFLPSRPIIRPFISSFGKLITVTVCSFATSAAYFCIHIISICLALSLTSSFASSSFSLIK